MGRGGPGRHQSQEYLTAASRVPDLQPNLCPSHTLPLGCPSSKPLQWRISTRRRPIMQMQDPVAGMWAGSAPFQVLQDALAMVCTSIHATIVGREPRHMSMVWRARGEFAPPPSYWKPLVMRRQTPWAPGSQPQGTWRSPPPQQSSQQYLQRIIKVNHIKHKRN